MDLSAKFKAIEIGKFLAQFDDMIDILKLINNEVISLKQNAQLRMESAKELYSIKNSGNWTREAFVYVPRKGVFLVKNSPMIENAKEAVQAFKNRTEYFLADEQVESCLASSVKLTGIKIPTNRFKDNEITSFAFEDVAEKYGNFLYESGIKEMPVYLTCFSDKPFARQMKFMGSFHNSAFNSIGNLLDNFSLYGVKNRK